MKNSLSLSFSINNTYSHFPKETAVDQTRRHCSVEMIRGTGPSELGWSQPISKNPIERAWTQWVQRQLSNRREQILHFDLSRKGREAITLHPNHDFSLITLSVHLSSFHYRRRAVAVLHNYNIFPYDSFMTDISKEWRNLTTWFSLIMQKAYFTLLTVYQLFHF